MNDILRPYLRKFIAVFLDDILIFSKTWKDHLEHVGEIMEVLQRNQLFCKPSKCIFGATEILHLGHFVSGNSIRPDPKKLAAVEEWPVPELITQVRSFLVFANYFRRFIPRFAEIAQPLDEVTGRHAQFSWNKKRQDAFDSLKLSLLCAPVLQLPDVSKPFRVHTDANDVAIAAGLEQERDSSWHPVPYTSRKLTMQRRDELHHCRTRNSRSRFALTSWKLYLFQHFDLFTDSQAVIYLQSKRHVTKREAHWMETLADFRFTLHHVPGKANMADPLTRQLRQDPPLDLSFWSVLTFLHHGIEEVERHLL